MCQPWSAFLILPLFAFANAGIAEDLLLGCSIRSHGDHPWLSSASRSGIFHPSAGWLCPSGIAQLPEEELQTDFLPSASCVASASTMSMFIASLVFEHGGLDYAATAPRSQAGSTTRGRDGLHRTAGYRCPIGRRIKVRRVGGNHRMVSHAGESCNLGKWPGRLSAGLPTSASCSALSQWVVDSTHSCWGLTGKSSETFAERALKQSCRRGESSCPKALLYRANAGCRSSRPQAQFDANRLARSATCMTSAVELQLLRNPPGAGTPSR